MDQDFQGRPALLSQPTSLGNSREAHVDHIIPDDPANLQVLCSGCHAKKTNHEMKALALRRKPDRYSSDQPHHFS
jgi:5-methylcytosine-specific restriction endonuclease McrA